MKREKAWEVTRAIDNLIEAHIDVLKIAMEPNIDGPDPDRMRRARRRSDEMRDALIEALNPQL